MHWPYSIVTRQIVNNKPRLDRQKVGYIYSASVQEPVLLLYITAFTASVQYCMCNYFTFLYVLLLYITACIVSVHLCMCPSVHYCIYCFCTFLHVLLLYITVYTASVHYCMYCFCTLLHV
jgi:hypothetical protein